MSEINTPLISYQEIPPINPREQAPISKEFKENHIKYPKTMIKKN